MYDGIRQIGHIERRVEEQGIGQVGLAKVSVWKIGLWQLHSRANFHTFRAR